MTPIRGLVNNDSGGRSPYRIVPGGAPPQTAAYDSCVVRVLQALAQSVGSSVGMAPVSRLNPGGVTARPTVPTGAMKWTAKVSTLFFFSFFLFHLLCHTFSFGWFHSLCGVCVCGGVHAGPRPLLMCSELIRQGGVVFEVLWLLYQLISVTNGITNQQKQNTNPPNVPLLQI